MTGAKKNNFSHDHHDLLPTSLFPYVVAHMTGLSFSTVYIVAEEHLASLIISCTSIATTSSTTHNLEKQSPPSKICVSASMVVYYAANITVVIGATQHNSGFAAANP